MTDLRKINGIGEAHAAALIKMGITTLVALAAITEPDKFVDAAVFKPEDLAKWIEDAKALSVGDTGVGAGEGSKSADGGSKDASGDAGGAGAAGANEAPKKPRARGGKKGKAADKPSGPRRSVVLLVDEKGVGARGEIVNLPTGTCETLRSEGKARRATLDDFKKAGKGVKAKGA